MDIFEMSATYINSICFNHPFVDGNKRVAAICALAFLDINGFNFKEKYDEELADKILHLVNKKITKNDLAKYFKENCRKKRAIRRRRRR
jgi:death-on-curing protein